MIATIIIIILDRLEFGHAPVSISWCLIYCLPQWLYSAVYCDRGIVLSVCNMAIDG